FSRDWSSDVCSSDLTSAVVTSPIASEPPVDPQSLERLRALLHDQADAMVAAFYQVLLDDPEAQTFLHHSIVQERLSPSLRNWLIDRKCVVKGMGGHV